MIEHWLSLTDIPSEGKDFSIDEQSIWQNPIDEFELPYFIHSPLHAQIFLLPQKRSCLVRGHLQGHVFLPCARCAEYTPLAIDNDFEIFENLPPAQEEADLGPWFLRQTPEGLEIDIAGILWEQFLLMIPVKILCSEQCAGLCPHCGQNRNFALCDCEKNSFDPRMEIFRRIKVD